MWEQVEKVKQMIEIECRTNVAGYIANYAAQKNVQVATVQLMIQFHYSNPNQMDGVVKIYSHGKRMNGGLYVRTLAGNWINLRLIIFT